MSCVLFLSFGPFSGRKVNGSTTLATMLANSSPPEGMIFKSAVLPVIWGEPQKIIPDLVEKMNPTLVIGFGEGSKGKFEIELRGKNKTGNTEDASGCLPTEAFLIEDGPSALVTKNRLREEEIELLKECCPTNFEVSWDPQEYLCNSMIYCGLLHTDGMFNFIHVPPQFDTPDEEYGGKYLDFLKCLIEKLIHAKLA